MTSSTRSRWARRAHAGCCSRRRSRGWTGWSTRPPSSVRAASPWSWLTPSGRQACWQAAAGSLGEQLRGGGGGRLLREQLAAGCVAQVSVSSLTGAHGHEAQVSGWALVDYGLAHVLASD